MRGLAIASIIGLVISLILAIVGIILIATANSDIKKLIPGGPTYIISLAAAVMKRNWGIALLIIGILLIILFSILLFFGLKKPSTEKVEVVSKNRDDDEDLGLPGLAPKLPASSPLAQRRKLPEAYPIPPEMRRLAAQR